MILLQGDPAQDQVRRLRDAAAVHRQRCAPTIVELLNDPLWIRYIGDRNVRTVDDARGHLETLGGVATVYNAS